MSRWSIPWPGADVPAGRDSKPTGRSSGEPLAWQFVALAAVGVVTLMVLLWLGLWRWLSATVRRIEVGG